MDREHPHDGQPVLHGGAPLHQARLIALMLHGRGASAADILGVARAFTVSDVAYLAPQAAGHTWYPYSFLQPIERNEPYLSSALQTIATLIEEIGAKGHTDASRIVLLGFSQGACLASEFAARHARRYGGLVALSGGLIGPAGTPRHYSGTFDGMPAFFGCSDIDAHIPLERVEESAAVYERMGAHVDKRIYPRMGHIINDNELEAVNNLLAGKV